MTPVRVRLVDPDEHPALVELVLHEQPHAERAEIAPFFLDDSIVLERRAVAAYDEGRLVGCGASRPPSAWAPWPETSPTSCTPGSTRRIAVAASRSS
jgi:hypothetical protein